MQETFQESDDRQDAIRDSAAGSSNSASDSAKTVSPAQRRAAVSSIPAVSDDGPTPWPLPPRVNSKGEREIKLVAAGTKLQSEHAEELEYNLKVLQNGQRVSLAIFEKISQLYPELEGNLPRSPEHKDSSTADDIVAYGKETRDLGEVGCEKQVENKQAQRNEIKTEMNSDNEEIEDDDEYAEEEEETAIFPVSFSNEHTEDNNCRLLPKMQLANLFGGGSDDPGDSRQIIDAERIRHSTYSAKEAVTAPDKLQPALQNQNDLIPVGEKAMTEKDDEDGADDEEDDREYSPWKVTDEDKSVEAANGCNVDTLELKAGTKETQQTNQQDVPTTKAELVHLGFSSSVCSTQIAPTKASTSASEANVQCDAQPLGKDSQSQACSENNDGNCSTVVPIPSYSTKPGMDLRLWPSAAVSPSSTSSTSAAAGPSTSTSVSATQQKRMKKLVKHKLKLNLQIDIPNSAHDEKGNFDDWSSVDAEREDLLFTPVLDGWSETGTPDMFRDNDGDGNGNVRAKRTLEKAVARAEARHMNEEQQRQQPQSTVQTADCDEVSQRSLNESARNVRRVEGVGIRQDTICTSTNDGSGNAQCKCPACSSQARPFRGRNRVGGGGRGRQLLRTLSLKRTRSTPRGGTAATPRTGRYSPSSLALGLGLRALSLTSSAPSPSESGTSDRQDSATSTSSFTMRGGLKSCVNIVAQVCTEHLRLDVYVRNSFDKLRVHERRGANRTGNLSASIEFFEREHGPGNADRTQVCVRHSRRRHAQFGNVWRFYCDLRDQLDILGYIPREFRR